MLYRVLKKLDTGHRTGDVVEGNLFAHLDVLVRKGALAPVKTPPLAELPGWETRAEKLGEIGIETVQDLVDADLEEVRKLFDYKRLTTVEKWVAEARQWLQVTPRVVRSN